MQLIKLLTNQSIALNDGVVLWRCVAAFDDAAHGVRAGDVGGWAQSLNNVGANCWIADNAMLWGNAQLQDGSLLAQNAQVWGDALVTGRSTVTGHARAFGWARIEGGATVRGSAWVYGLAHIRRGALIQQNARVFERGQVGKRARVGGSVVICGTAEVYASISGNEYLTFGVVA